MTDEQICRAISESLEPKPNWYPGDQIQMPQSEAWYFDFSDTGEWQPLRWFTDPAARDLLVRKILGAGWEIHLYPQVGDERCMAVSLVPPDKKRPKYVSDTYDRIWPLAYLKTTPAAKETK